MMKIETVDVYILHIFINFTFNIPSLNFKDRILIWIRKRMRIQYSGSCLRMYKDSEPLPESIIWIWNTDYCFGQENCKVVPY